MTYPCTAAVSTWERPPLPHGAVEQRWHIKVGQGQIMALAFRLKSLKPFKLYPLPGKRDTAERSEWNGLFKTRRPHVGHFSHAPPPPSSFDNRALPPLSPEFRKQSPPTPFLCQVSQTETPPPSDEFKKQSPPPLPPSSFKDRATPPLRRVSKAEAGVWDFGGRVGRMDSRGGFTTAPLLSVSM